MWSGKALRWLRHWVPFTARTLWYASISLLLGPLTPDRRACLWASRAWSRSCLRLLRISVELRGVENLPDGGLIYACNHQSLLDTLLLGATLPGDFKWVVKSSVMRIPFLGWHLRLAGHVRVDQGVGGQAATTIDRFVRVLGQGKPLIVFPEGTRSEDGQLKTFRKGGFFAAVRAGVPVVPVALEGTGDMMAKGTADLGPSTYGASSQPRQIRVRIGEPLHARPGSSELDRASELRDRTRAAVLQLQRSLEEEDAAPHLQEPTSGAHGTRDAPGRV